MTLQILIVASLPALLGSLLLLNFAAAPKALFVQQCAVFLVAIAATLLYARYLRKHQESRKLAWPLIIMTCLVCFPMAIGNGTSSAPDRWVGFFGFRLYIAPVVLPFFLLLWSRSMSDTTAAVNWATVSAAVVALGLFAQPDAAQLTAFSLASIPVLWNTRCRTSIKLLTIAIFLLAAAISWRIPDPLAPVPYVEGIFVLALQYSGWALFFSVVAAATPVIALGYVAYLARAPEILAVGLYFAALYLLAPLQVTPVPLLGFGAGPIIGYFIMASQVWRRSTNAA